MAAEFEGDIMKKLIEDDMFYAIFSVMFVFVYMYYHLKSTFLAIIAMLIILLSFPLTVLITEGILRSSYFS